LVTILAADPDRRYNPSDFEPYLIAFDPTTNGHAGPVHLPDDLPHIDFRTLEVSYRIKSLILDGEDRLNPEKSPSRSEPLFGVLRALVSKGYDDSTIASVLLNPAYKISEKPLERGRPWLEQEISRIRAKPAPEKPIADTASIPTPQHNNHNPQEIQYGSDPAGDTKETIARLAALSPIAYDRAREAKAQALGIRLSTLDHIVAQARGNGEEPSGQGQAITFADDEETPWPESVDGAQLLDTIAKTYRRYVVLPLRGDDALSLWTLHTHAHDVASVAPTLALQSPQKRCGQDHDATDCFQPGGARVIL
jgi:hypothetical protein